MMDISRRERSAIQGFTMLELLAVLSVISIVVIIAVPGLQRSMQGPSAEQLAASIVTTLSRARTQAVVRATSRQVRFDLDVFSIDAGTGTSIELQRDATYVIRTAKSEVLGQKATFAFNADGSSTGGEIAITDRYGQHRVVRVHWLTGLIYVDDGKP